jgi:H2-forming N5,N10-methylenetetrahydromethanopterin dehydrogenase-like enzyme
MEEARAVLLRLDRIERLDRAGAAPDVLLSELRELVREAEEWSRVEGAGADAVDRCRDALEQGGVVARAG